MNAAGKDLDVPFPSKLGFTKEKGDGSSLKWNTDRERLEGGLSSDKKSNFACIETCAEPTTTTQPTTPMASDKCGEGWIELEDQTCI